MLRKTSGRMETELTFRISVSLIFWGSTLTFLEVAHCLTLCFGCSAIAVLGMRPVVALTCRHGCGTGQTWHSALVYGNLAHVHPPTHTLTHSKATPEHQFGVRSCDLLAAKSLRICEHQDFSIARVASLSGI